MSNKSSNRTSNLGPTAGVRLLKDRIAGMESALKHLHSALGGHIDALDKALVKGENVKPVKPRTHLLKAAASPLSAGGIFSDFIRGMGKINGTGGRSGGGSDLLSGGDSFGMSRGQLWAQIAGAISSASKRYL